MDFLRAIFRKTISRPVPPQEGAGLTHDMTAADELLYGTAWKKLNTANLVYQALKAGYRALDTAAQPRHYREDLVAEGLKRAFEEGFVTRNQVHVQTKFSPSFLQDDTTIPYNSNDHIHDQVTTSIESSLRNFALSSPTPDTSNPAPEPPYLDTLLLHSLLPSGEETLSAWHAMEQFVPHRVRRLGICNITLAQLQALCNAVTIKPAVVQNRFYKDTGYDCELRRFCTENGIRYQAYWILKKNQQLLETHLVRELAREVQVSREAALFFWMQRGLGVSVVDGATRLEHVCSNVEDLETMGNWAGQLENKESLVSLGEEFVRSLEGREPEERVGWVAGTGQRT